jgi:YgiT-type zinc finger domain-containing protein
MTQSNTKPLIVRVCPICGSKRIRQVKRDITSRRGGRSFVARDVTIEECPNCGERLFSPESLAQIAASQPRIQKRRRKSA